MIREIRELCERPRDELAAAARRLEQKQQQQPQSPPCRPAPSSPPPARLPSPIVERLGPAPVSAPAPAPPVVAAHEPRSSPQAHHSQPQAVAPVTASVAAAAAAALVSSPGALHMPNQQLLGALIHIDNVTINQSPPTPLPLPLLFPAGSNANSNWNANRSPLRSREEPTREAPALAPHSGASEKAARSPEQRSSSREAHAARATTPRKHLEYSYEAEQPSRSSAARNLNANASAADEQLEEQQLFLADPNATCATDPASASLAFSLVASSPPPPTDDEVRHPLTAAAVAAADAPRAPFIDVRPVSARHTPTSPRRQFPLTAAQNPELQEAAARAVHSPPVSVSVSLSPRNSPQSPSHPASSSPPRVVPVQNESAFRARSSNNAPPVRLPHSSVSVHEQRSSSMSSGSSRGSSSRRHLPLRNAVLEAFALHESQSHASFSPAEQQQQQQQQQLDASSGAASSVSDATQCLTVRVPDTVRTPPARDGPPLASVGTVAGTECRSPRGLMGTEEQEAASDASDVTISAPALEFEPDSLMPTARTSDLDDDF